MYHGSEIREIVSMGLKAFYDAFFLMAISELSVLGVFIFNAISTNITSLILCT